MHGHLFFIMGVSGSGKGTLKKNLENSGNENYDFPRSYVTREMRPGEVDGESYHFVSRENFETAIENNEFLEYETNHKIAYYGTKRAEIDTGIQDGKLLFKEVDTKGLKQIHEKHPDFKANYSSIFLDVPDDVLRKRFFERNPEGLEEDFQNRLESTLFERQQAEEYCDYIIDATKSPESVLEDVLAIIEYTGSSIS